MTFPLLDCSEFGNFVITLIHIVKLSVVDRISFERGRIVAIDLEGNIKWFYRGHQNKTLDPCDILSTSKGNIIISEIS